MGHGGVRVFARARARARVRVRACVRVCVPVFENIQVESKVGRFSTVRGNIWVLNHFGRRG